MNSIISWVGGKKALRDTIYQRMPISYERYIEVFGGAGWVLFGRRPGREMEVYNDLNTNLVNLFRCVRDRPMRLVEELSFFPLNSREDFRDLVRFLKAEDFGSPFLADELAVVQRHFTGEEARILAEAVMGRAEPWDVRRAAAFYKVIRYSYGSGCTAYCCQPADLRKTFGTLWEAGRRLKDTVIENKDFGALIRQYDREHAFFYCDPPYYKTEGHYEVVFREEDHERLRDTLSGIKGRFMVSYNDCEYVRKLYRGFKVEAVTRLNNLAQRYDGGCEFPEILIANYDMGEQGRHLPVQVRMDDLFGCRWLPGDDDRGSGEDA